MTRLTLTCVFVAALAAACGGNSNGSSPNQPSNPNQPPPATTTFQGIIAGTNGQTGTLSVTVQTQVSASTASLFRLPFVATLHAQGGSTPASGSVRVAGGTPTSVSGTYDAGTRSLTLSGNGFSFTGSVSGGVLTGTYAGPGGTSGSFATQNAASGNVTSYCGNVFGAPPSTSDVTGIFNLVVADATGAVSGAFQLIGSAGHITGHVTGTSLSITYTDRTSGQSGTATGTIEGGNVSGVSTTGNPFSASTSRCQNVLPPSPPAPTLTGTWHGQWTTYDASESCGRDLNDAAATLTQNGDTVSGTLTWTIRESFYPPDIGTTNSQPISGSVSGSSVSFTLGRYSGSGTFTSTALTGSFDGAPCQAMPFSLTRQ